MFKTLIGDGVFQALQTLRKLQVLWLDLSRRLGMSEPRGRCQSRTETQHIKHTAGHLANTYVQAAPRSEMVIVFENGCCITLGCIGSKKLVVHPAPEGEKQSRVRSSAAEGCSAPSGSEGTMATIRKMICPTEYLVNRPRHPRGQPKAGAWH